ncbi:RNA polymerase sigma factor [Olsenella uli]|uniref:RNA polymerase sigma factor n=1 Tax=Olsenella uli TaxID=133926 RepID=UPI00195CC516
MRGQAEMERAMGEHADAVWRACLVYLPAADAEDVFQETFLKYALHDEPFRDDAHARAWLLRVAINGCKDALRAARRRDVSLEERVERLGEGAVGAEAPSELGLREVLDAMAALGDPPRTQLYLALCEGYSAREIAGICDMPVGTVYSWISRGKRKLREVLS